MGKFADTREPGPRSMVRVAFSNPVAETERVYRPGDNWEIL
jgi:hypothetical protein